MKILIVDHGAGNLHSLSRAVTRAAEMAGVTVSVAVGGEACQAGEADSVILPGVGAFSDCRAGLMARPGLEAALEETVIRRRRPCLGICVGAQLLGDRGVEFRETPGLGWIPGATLPIPADPARYRIPHTGWNEVIPGRPHPLMDGLEKGVHMYFVHSYHLVPGDLSDRLAVTDYGGVVTAAVVRGNVAGVQFHPEKSQECGLRLLRNFLLWSP